MHFIFPQPDGWVTVWVRGLLFCLINVTTMTKQALLKPSLTVHSVSYFNSWVFFFPPQEKLPLPFPFIIAFKWKCHIFLLFTLHSQDFLKLLNYKLSKGFPGGSDSKESARNAGDQGSIPGSGKATGGGNGNPPHYSCLKNAMDRRPWQATVHGVKKSWTWQSD